MNLWSSKQETDFWKIKILICTDSNNQKRWIWRERGTSSVLVNDAVSYKKCTVSLEDEMRVKITSRWQQGKPEIFGGEERIFQCYFVHHKTHPDCPGVELYDIYCTGIKDVKVTEMHPATSLLPDPNFWDWICYLKIWKKRSPVLFQTVNNISCLILFFLFFLRSINLFFVVCL
jgi:hypothetical protein